jgi:hypothetical protein
MTKARDIASAAPAPAGVTSTELGYVDGVTSAIQTQVDAKIAKTLTTTTGDIIYASGADTPARLGIGSTDQVLKVTGGVPAWATPAASGGMTLLNAGGTAMSGASTSVSIDPTGYTALEIFIKDAYSNTNDGAGFMRINGDSGSNYGYSAIRWDGGPSVTGVQQNATTYLYYIFNNLPSDNTTLLKGNSQITLFQPTATTNVSVHWQSISGQNSGLQSSTVGGGTYDASAAVTSVSIHCGGAATWSGGTIYVYGVK